MSKKKVIKDEKVVVNENTVDESKSGSVSMDDTKGVPTNVELSSDSVTEPDPSAENEAVHEDGRSANETESNEGSNDPDNAEEVTGEGHTGSGNDGEDSPERRSDPEVEEESSSEEQADQPDEGSNETPEVEVFEVNDDEPIVLTESERKVAEVLAKRSQKAERLAESCGHNR